MTCTKNKVAAQIKKLNKKCLLTHCYCSSLNLAVGDSVKNIPLLKDTLNMAYEITKLIKKSPKREAEFQRIQPEFWGQIERDFHAYDMESPHSENSVHKREDSLSCISERLSEELWNFDKAVGMGTIQYQ